MCASCHSHPLPLPSRSTLEGPPLLAPMWLPREPVQGEGSDVEGLGANGPQPL
jgi:hypothetical protein